MRAWRTVLFAFCARAKHVGVRVLAEESGNIAILGALTLPLVVGGFAFGTEASYWSLEQRKLQNAADVSAHAAGVALRSGEAQISLVSTATDIAGFSGFDASVGTLTVNTPPQSGGFAGNLKAVEVLLGRDQERYFTKLFSPEPVEITARAVSAVMGGSRACLLALSPTAVGAVTVSGSTQVTFEGCDIASNSNSDDSFLMLGGSAVVTTGCVHTVGGTTATGNLTLTDCAAPNEQAPVSSDPYGDVPEPAVTGTCQAGTVGSNGSTTRLTPIENHPTGVMSMRFCGGMDLRGRVELDPGLYIVDGGEFQLNSTTVAIGSSITFFLANGARAVINGSATLDVSAPSSGPFSGMVLFGSRADTGVTHQINGNSASRMDGAVYAPSSGVDYSGNFGGSGGCTQIVVNNITFIGNSALSVNCQAVGTRDVLVDQKVTIVE